MDHAELADGLPEREICSISPETVRRSLKKTNSSLGFGVLVPPASGQCRIRVRHGGRAGVRLSSEYQDNEVLVCLDETSKQLVQETRTPLPPRPGEATGLLITSTSETG